jgi:regulatory protein
MTTSPQLTITALEPQERRPDRYNLFIDGAFALGVDGATVVAEGFYVGKTLAPAELEDLKTHVAERGLFDAALRFLAARPRSRAEVRRRLLTPRPKKPAPEPEAVDRVLDALAERSLLDDGDFAAFWVENRERFSPRSARALGQELRQRGVSRETVEELSQPERDAERALDAGRQRLRVMGGADYETFRTRMGQFLQRRGFSYGVAREAVRALWAEAGGSDGDDEADAPANSED